MPGWGSSRQGRLKWMMCKARRMMDRWWWTDIECGKKQGEFPTKKAISYSCIVITFTVIHLSSLPEAELLTPQPWNPRSFHMRQDSSQTPIRVPCLCFPLSPALFIFNRLWGCVAYLHPTCLCISRILAYYTRVMKIDNSLNTINWEYWKFSMVKCFYKIISGWGSVSACWFLIFLSQRLQKASVSG